MTGEVLAIGASYTFDVCSTREGGKSNGSDGDFEDHGVRVKRTVQARLEE